jgi:acyl-coenzyme A thioesterase PaaI-like protein
MTVANTQPNRLQRMLAPVERVPAGIRTWVRTKALGRGVPFTGTAGMRYEELTPERVVVSVANVKKVRNHIGGVHAMASSLAAESATGMIVGMNVRDDCSPVIKDIRLSFVKRGQGAMRAVASLTPEQRELIRSTTKGETVVPVTITDESGREPITCEFTWAWVPNERSPKAS